MLGDLEIDPAQRRVPRGGEAAHLTPTEFDLLLYMAGQPRTVLAREALLGQVWGWSHVSRHPHRRQPREGACGASSAPT